MCLGYSYWSFVIFTKDSPYFFLPPHGPPNVALFPYTTLFRSLPAAPRLAEPGPAPRPRRGATGARGLGARGTGGREPALPAEEPRLRPLRGRPDREDLRRARGAPRGHPRRNGPGPHRSRRARAAPGGAAP